MSDLPTREETKATVRARDFVWLGSEGGQITQAILQAFIDGRLVDRETIDYEAGGKSFFDAGKLPGDPNPETWESVSGWVREEYRGHFRRALKAGGVDEHS